MNKVNKKYPNFQDVFSLEDIEVARNVIETRNCGMSRIALNAPSQIYRLNKWLFNKNETTSALIKYKTLKFRYAEEVWYKAVLISENNPSNMLYYWWLHWEDNNTSFRELAESDNFRNITTRELLDGFWTLLREIADSGGLKVNEGYHIYSQNMKDFFKEPQIACDVIIDAKEARDIEKVIDDVYAYPYDKAPKSFSWKDIEPFFTELTLNQLRLTMPSFMHKHDSLDDMLSEASFRQDYELMEMLIKRGANVNSLNERGESPLQRVVEYSWAIDDDINSEETTPLDSNEHRLKQTKKCIDLLLDNGADIDLFGYDGMQPLACAYYDHSVELVKYLLDKGSNPNYNSYLMDNEFWPRLKNVRCTILEVINDDLYEEYDDTEKVIEKLIREHGGRQFTWDYDPLNYENIHKYFIKLALGKKLFCDNANWYIGDFSYIDVEHEDGSIERIDISMIKGLKDWQEVNCTAREWISKEQYDIGYRLAKEVLKVLPDDVALFYQPTSKYERIEVKK